MPSQWRSWWRRTVATVSMLSVWLVAAPALVYAQDSTSAPPPPGVSATLDSARAVRGASLTVSLYTFGPSDLFFERFGHAAIGIRDSLTGQDVSFNWGMFSFEQPNFLLRFLTGDTKYSMAGFNTDQFNATYRADNRTIRQQVLVMSPVERAALLEYVQWNALEENMYYRYDYYRDNCATRIRDLLDRTLQGRLKAKLDSAGPGRTWRNETARVLEYNLPLYAGIQIALGHRADAPLTRWEEEFLPEHMAEHYGRMVFTNTEGRRVPLVAHDTILYASTRVGVPEDAPSWLPMAALAGLTLAGLLAGMADARSRLVHIILALLVALWYSVGGILGTALLLAATVTKHVEYMGANTTLLALQPLLLVAAVVVPVALIRQRASRAALGISTVIAGLSLCAVVAQLVPAWAQSSGVVLAVVVPVHVAIAMAMWRLGHNNTRR